jgi:leucyl-tRNA synthetase
MAYQGLLAEDGVEPNNILEIKGTELVGTKVAAPNAVHKEVYVVPMDSVSATKVCPPL